MSIWLRRLVSKHKRRYQDDGFDLDLAFIDFPPQLQGRLLAMAYPTEGKEAWYRNHFKEVRRFLEHYKAKGTGDYKVYNLTAERPTYSAQKLGGQLANFQFEDHQVPNLQQMMEFCSNLDAFLASHPENFAAVHCKAGKGRTGVMICAFLLHKKLASNAAQAMEIYAQQRSRISSGITVASQRRYVQYYEAVVAEQRIPAAPELVLKSVSVSGFYSQRLAKLVLVVSVRCPTTDSIYKVATLKCSEETVKMHRNARSGLSEPMAAFQPLPGNSFPNDYSIKGDVRLEVFLNCESSSTLLFRTWFNTAFLSKGKVVFCADDLDKGAHTVKPETVLVLELTDEQTEEACPECTSPDLRGLEPCLIEPALTGSSAGLSSSSHHVLHVHPDFSIPTNFRPSSRRQLGGFADPYPSVFAMPAAQQWLEAPIEEVQGSKPLKVSIEDLSQRLECLAEGKKVLNDGRRSKSGPASWTAYLPLKGVVEPIPRSISLAKLRPSQRDAGVHWDDPELEDYSAPTTPSMPRPLTSIDWQQNNMVMPMTLHGRSSVETQWTSSFQPGSQLPEVPGSPIQEGIISGQNSPSHGAQIIKWMSSSWWLTMA